MHVRAAYARACVRACGVAEDFNAFLRDLRVGFGRYFVQPFVMGVAAALGLSVGACARRFRARTHTRGHAHAD